MFIPLSFSAPAKINPGHAIDWDSVLFLGINADGSLGITTTRNCTHFLKIGFAIAGGGHYSYYIHQGNKSDKERKIARKKLSFMLTKRFNKSFKIWVHFNVYHADKCVKNTNCPTNFSKGYLSLGPCLCICNECTNIEYVISWWV